MKRRRVVVAVDATPQARAALAAAAAAARRLEAELVALFIEDESLMSLAHYPFAREIGFPSATARRLDPATLERLVRLHAEELRRTLEREARSFALTFRFEVARAGEAARLEALAAEAELVVAAVFSSPWTAERLERLLRSCAASARVVAARSAAELDAMLSALLAPD